MTSRRVFHSISYKGQDFKIISDSAVISAIMFQSVYKPNISSGSQENLYRLFAAILASQHQRSPGNIVQGLEHFTSETRYNSKYQYAPNKNTPILLVPCIDVGSFVNQKLAYSWTAHLGGQSKRCPSILNRQKFKSENHCAHLSSWPKHERNRTVWILTKSFAFTKAPWSQRSCTLEQQSDIARWKEEDHCDIRNGT